MPIRPLLLTAAFALSIGAASAAPLAVPVHLLGPPRGGGASL